MTEILESLNIYNIINWLTDMPWYGHVIGIMLLGHCIFMNNANKIYNKDMTQKDKQIYRLKNKIIIIEWQTGIRAKLPDDFVLGPGEFLSFKDHIVCDIYDESGNKIIYQADEINE